MPAFIRVEGLEFAYSLDDERQILALRGIDLSIERGEFVAIVGANGSGKSTLARHLNGLLLPSAGQVWVDGLTTANSGHLAAIRQRVGMVFQNPDHQLVASTLEEDVAFGPENLGLPPADIRRRVDEALAVVGLDGYRLQPPHLLSGGQKQRAAIAGVLAMRPACIVLDEPTSMLDPPGRRQVLDTICRLNAEGITVVLITQAMDEAALARRLVVMAAGQIAGDGPPAAAFGALGHDGPIPLPELGLPFAADMARRLRALGVPLPAGILTANQLTDHLARALC